MFKDADWSTKKKKSKKFLTKVWILTLVSFSFPNTVEDKIDEPSIHFWCFILMHMYVPTMALDSLFTFYDISFQFPTYLSYLDSLWHVTISDFRYSFYSDYIVCICIPILYGIKKWFSSLVILNRDTLKKYNENQKPLQKAYFQNNNYIHAVC